MYMYMLGVEKGVLSNCVLDKNQMVFFVQASGTLFVGDPRDVTTIILKLALVVVMVIAGH